MFLVEKMQKLKKIISKQAGKRLLAFIMCFIILQCDNLFETVDIVNAKESTKSFEMLSCENVTAEEFNECYQKLLESIHHKDTQTLVFARYDELYDLLLKKLQYLEMKDIQNSLDRNQINPLYVEENREYREWNDLVCSIGKTLCESITYGKSAKNHFSEKTYEAYCKYEPLTKTQKEILIRIDELQEHINRIKSETVIEYKGKTYTLTTLEEQRLNQAISNNLYWDIYDEFAETMFQQMSHLYIEMIKERTNLAKSFGYNNYIEYEYANVYGRDYSYQDTINLREYIQTEWLETYHKRQNQINDYTNNWKSTKIKTQEGLEIAKKYLTYIDESFSDSIEMMNKNHLCDLEKKPGKADYSFVASLNYDMVPFLSINGVENTEQLNSLVHELGHFNAEYQMDEESWKNLLSNVDISEIHSQANVLIFSMFYKYFLDEPCKEQLIAINNVEKQIMYASMMDTIENELYFADQITGNEINGIYRKWLNTYYRTNIKEGNPTEKYWIFDDLLYSNPGYYFSYIVSGISSYDIFFKTKENFQYGTGIYKNIIEGQYNLSYQELLEENELINPFNIEETKSIIKNLNDTYARLLQGKAVSVPYVVKKMSGNFSKK